MRKKKRGKKNNKKEKKEERLRKKNNKKVKEEDRMRKKGEERFRESREGPELMGSKKACQSLLDVKRPSTMVQNHQESRCRFWATHWSVSSHRSFSHFLRPARFARILCSHASLHSFVHSLTYFLTPELV